MIEFHEDFYRDLDKLSKAELGIFHKKRKKIKANPERPKHLAGGDHCYRERVTRNVRLIYYLEGNRIWFLTIGPHDKTYEEYRERLQKLRLRIR